MSLKRGEGRSVSLTLRRSSALSASTSGFSRHQKKFPNGDTYTGGWRNGLPEGEGRYCWADGSTFDGGWKVILLSHLFDKRNCLVCKVFMTHIYGNVHHQRFRHEGM